jgi:prefoldin subunit 2
MDPKQEHLILQKYRELVSECQQLMQKIAELETDFHEHQLVEQTLIPLDPDRRAYRLVGDVLVERTVKEVLPSVTANRENVRIKRRTMRNCVLRALTDSFRSTRRLWYNS